MPMISGPRQTAGKDANASKEDPGLRAGDCLLKIFRQASAAIEPSKCPFDPPALWLRFKCTGTLSSCDDLDKPLAELRERLEQLLPAVHAVQSSIFWRLAANGVLCRRTFRHSRRFSITFTIGATAMFGARSIESWSSARAGRQGASPRPRPVSLTARA